MHRRFRTGAHSNRVAVLLKPMVALSVGKNALKLRETTMLVSASASHQTFQSVIALTKPAVLPCSVWPSSPMPAKSSSMRLWASRHSMGLSQLEVVDGKSGRMNIAQIATWPQEVMYQYSSNQTMLKTDENREGTLYVEEPSEIQKGVAWALKSSNYWISDQLTSMQHVPTCHPYHPVYRKQSKIRKHCWLDYRTTEGQSFVGLNTIFITMCLTPVKYLWPSSLLLYHFDSKKSDPGKKAASTNPKKKRVSNAPKKLQYKQCEWY